MTAFLQVIWNSAKPAWERVSRRKNVWRTRSTSGPPESSFPAIVAPRTCATPIRPPVSAAPCRLPWRPDPHSCSSESPVHVLIPSSSRSSFHTTEPKHAEENGKKCYHCIGKDCTATARCRGNEDRCISKSGSTTTPRLQRLARDSNCGLSLTGLCLSVDRGKGLEVSKGCVTRQVCDVLKNPHLRTAIGGEIKCCQGDFCNSGSGTSASLLLLAAPLLPLVMFS